MTPAEIERRDYANGKPHTNVYDAEAIDHAKLVKYELEEFNWRPETVELTDALDLLKDFFENECDGEREDIARKIRKKLLVLQEDLMGHFAGTALKVEELTDMTDEFLTSKGE